MRHLLIAIILLAVTGAGSGAETTPCSPCGASGKCHVCEGDGQRTDGSQCTWCAGSKKCYYCSGQGRY